jgi:predicted SAM-dependent methyltransferase
MEKKIKYLNCGCGSRFHTDWENIDFVSYSAHVKQHDLTKGIPYPDNYFDVVYHSHVLEHFSKATATSFVQECYRVLRPGGIIRIAVPDLEMLAKNYLDNLNKVTNQYTELNHANYQWSVIELLDQMSRNTPGGEMLKYWDSDLINEEYITRRMGLEFMAYRKARKEEIGNNKLQVQDNNKKSIISGIREKIKRRFLNSYMPYINLGRFRLSGEVHQWMYDRYSLSWLLKSSGFAQIDIKDAYTSNIPEWAKYDSLDVEEGKPRKPDSLFMEAVK